ncbi:LOW QUALITY PROTEIN: tRNA (guanine-N(7)-)-methyltransferase non-catalytic subunit wdr4 [Osmia bicornis bicornis]|uniref:LOW QUALITY PROTEIN: tRNA (guanine-N(7)-)-methyltransferase non-catalytic subunit wdr4 n=1 Tax=Osmia bicornis bicornis TaxID=1437191 RepID=UPI001EAEEF0A|nr:LOW QUALITY PROTEIN: tRNA (guanine-N(7)-)-methyltransferase non-catalytic subunit wdr4 [Osmia bicornis bicornis]
MYYDHNDNRKCTTELQSIFRPHFSLTGMKGFLEQLASKIYSNYDIVVADKAEMFYPSFSKKPGNGILLLGHLSMLLDVLITEDENYIITTDRDEKIRVSMFPNSYNIMCYCLGHQKFVTNILELSHDKSILVSCGGDGKLILWDYKIGKELLSVDFNDKISKSDIEEFNQQFQGCHLEETIEILPVKHLRLSAITATSSLAVMSFYSSPLLLVYIVNGTVSNFEINYLQSIVTDSEPLECYIHKQNLWLLNDHGFKIYEFKDNFVPSNGTDYKINQLNSFWKTLKKDTVQQNLFSILYKRKYDNVQEYLQRKKTRLGSISE